MTKFIDITGQVFGELTAIERTVGVGTVWVCQCSCGNIRNVPSGVLRQGRATSCGCKNYIDISGQRFGRLTAESIHDKDRHGINWLCRCDCGNTSTVNGNTLRSGRTLSCGCLQKETTTKVHTTHGLSRSPEYKIWNSMITRCNSDHPRYGGRGIKVCDEWLGSFDNFIRDMGLRPDPSYTLDRRDNDGDYEPGNCRWADRTTQSVNQGMLKTNKTGVKGVSVTNTGKFLAELRVGGEVKLKQQFDTLEEASKARRLAEIEFHDPLL